MLTLEVRPKWIIIIPVSSEALLHELCRDKICKQDALSFSADCREDVEAVVFEKKKKTVLSLEGIERK